VSPSDHGELRAAVQRTCAPFPDRYWREMDGRHEYPTAFVEALTRDKWLAAPIPTECGGLGLGLTETSVVFEEIHRSGANATHGHAQVYMMGALLRHGDETQKRAYLPRLTAGQLRLQAFAVTEPDAGSETTRIEATAERRGDRYVVNGRKLFISRIEHSDLMLLLARTTPYDQLTDKTRGLSLFIVELAGPIRDGAIAIRPLTAMFNNHTTELEIRDLEVPAENLIGQEGMGFRYVIDGWNAERIVIAAECIGDGRWFVERGSAYASQRVVFGRPIGANQGVQFPLAKSYASVRAADLMRARAAELFDAGQPCGPEANMAKYLAAEAAWEAANACLDAYGGRGFLAEYDVERKFRETRLYRAAPINNNLVLAYLGQHVLGMPRSY
jgi:acyl-CoA dehydrogenase